MSNQEKQDFPIEAPKPSPAKFTASANKKVKNPKRVAVGKALAARNKEKLTKIKALEDDQQTIEVTETESEERSNWSCTVLLLLVGGVAVVVGAFGYQKWTASSNQQTSKPVNQHPATKPSESAKRSENPFEDFS